MLKLRKKNQQGQKKTRQLSNRDKLTTPSCRVRTAAAAPMPSSVMTRSRAAAAAALGTPRQIPRQQQQLCSRECVLASHHRVKKGGQNECNRSADLKGNQQNPKLGLKFKKSRKNFQRVMEIFEKKKFKISAIFVFFFSSDSLSSAVFFFPC